ncbi:hypothetical protein ACHWQZ_G012241 [Mnemiopsis leidyi]
MGVGEDKCAFCQSSGGVSVVFILLHFLLLKKLCEARFCNANLFTIQTLSGVIEDGSSHHKPIFAFFDTKLLVLNSTKPKQVQNYNFSGKNVQSLLEHLISNADSLTDVNTPLDFDGFFETFSSAVDKFCKLDKPKVTKRNPVCNPWILDSIVDAIDKKEELYDNWIASKTAPDYAPVGDIRLHKIFSDYRRCLKKKIIKHQKNNYYCNKILDNSENSKKIWEFINEIRGKKKKKMKPQFIVDGVRVVERRVIANKFNEYFSSIASKMNENNNGIHLEPLPSFLEFMPQRTQQSLFFYECDQEEISEIISNLKNGKASDFPIRVIKQLSNILSPALAVQFNRLISKGTFPSVLKLGKITPIYKKDNEELLENYRHVSTLPIFDHPEDLTTPPPSKYENGKQGIPPHSDNEECISSGSYICTVSLGETRTLEYRSISEASQISSRIQLVHGDILFMTRESQNLYQHSVPMDYTKNMRISITLRQITCPSTNSSTNPSINLTSFNCAETEFQDSRSQTIGFTTVNGVSTIRVDNQHLHNVLRPSKGSHTLPTIKKVYLHKHAQVEISKVLTLTLEPTVIKMELRARYHGQLHFTLAPVCLGNLAIKNFHLRVKMLMCFHTLGQLHKLSKSDL